jgi:putative transposase
MVTSSTWERRSLFQAEPWAKLLIDTLYHYRGSAYLLHEFVIMPDHIHILLTPLTSLEKAVQFIKGGFSFRAKKELGSTMEVWQKGFQDHRVRDAGDYAQHVRYIRENPAPTVRLKPHPFKAAPLRHAWKACPFKTESQSKSKQMARLTAYPFKAKPQIKSTRTVRLTARPFKARPSPFPRNARPRLHKCPNELTSRKS